MEWIAEINRIINKQEFNITRLGDTEYNELDVVLSLIQTNSNLADLKLEVKNYVSLLSNILEKIAHLTKEIALLRTSFDLEKTIIVNDKLYYYNYRLDTYLDESDLRKLEESHRRCLDLFKQFTRKIIYLIVTGKEEEKEIPQPQPQQPTFNIPFLPISQQPQQQQSEGENK